MTNVKKKRVSKKTKSSWRKHVDITDVENFLEDQRLEERLGKPFTEKSNDELFQLDIIPSKQTILTSKQKRRTTLHDKQPRCYSVLLPHSEVPDPVIKRNRVKTKEERKNTLIKKKEEKMKRSGIFKAKELQSLKDKKLYEVKKANKPKRGEFGIDIWNTEGIDGHTFSEWVDSNTKKHTLRGVGKLLKRAPKSQTSKLSVVPAIEYPHPGTSYNPTFEDHQALLQDVLKKETKLIKEEKHLQRVTKDMFKKLTPQERDKNWLSEMSECLPTNNTNDEEPENGDYKATNPPVKNKKKDLKQRRKQKEQQKLKLDQLLAKKEKRKVADIHKLKFLKNAIEKNEKKMELLRNTKMKKKEQQVKNPKRLSALKFEEEEIEFNAPPDIAGNLRNMKKEGNLLLHRFKSMQKRNILQPTTKRTIKKAKIKRFTKPNHKDDWKITVARKQN